MNTHNSMPLLAVEQAHKAYGSHTALRGATFEAHAGELLALLGPNGAGKTTLIRAICGRHRLDSGTILLEGVPIRTQRQRARLGLVPQELAVYPDLTVEQNMQAFARLHGVPESAVQPRVEEALHWTRLGDRRRDLAGKLSGGMQRRLNIACGVLHGPVVLLLDEPTVGVDPQSRERIFEMLQELKRGGTSIVLTTHQLDEAESRCDRIVIIDQGDVVASGSLDDLIKQTVGRSQQMTLQMSVGHERARKSRSHTFVVQNIVDDLPVVLDEARDKGVDIEQLNMRSPTLQDVFLHLTGKELRE